MLHFYKDDSIADFSNLKFRQTVESGAVQKCTDLVEIENTAKRKFIANVGFGTAESKRSGVEILTSFAILMNW